MRLKLSMTPVLILLMSLTLSAQKTLTERVQDLERVQQATQYPQAPGSPSPTSGATGVPGDVTLTCTVLNATSVDMYFGTTSPGAFVGNFPTCEYKPPTTLAGTKYYWHARGVNARGTKTGSTWNFTTAVGPPPPPPPPPSGLPVVPGAYGYGMQTRAAYACGTNPAILRVTNLNDSGAGSMRAALEATVPRVVIFEVSGYVDLADTVRISSPCVTVAGQTAPSPGITWRKYGMEVTTHDVLLQYFSVRPGEWGTFNTQNCGFIAYGVDAHDIVLDHMSFSWGPDENVAADTYNSGDMNMTIWRSIVAEGLDYPASVDYSPSHGILVMYKSKKVTIAQNILMTNRERNPFMHGETSTAIVNNLVFNGFAYWHFFFANVDWNGNVSGPWYSSVVGNRVIAGANTDDDPNAAQGWLFQLDKTNGVNTAGNKLYRSDNTVENAQAFPFDVCATLAAHSSCNEMDYDPTVTMPPAEAPLTNFPAPMGSTTVEAFLKQHAGARPLDRDPIEARLISDLTARTARGYRNSQTAYGGYPALTPGVRGLTPPANPHVVSATGYTNLEDWLHGYSTAVGE